MKNLIIIKTGQFETFASDSGHSFSLGDVLRTTAVLHSLDTRIKIHWLTHKNAIALLPSTGKVAVHEFSHDLLNFLTTQDDLFVINLERDPSLIPFLQSTKNFAGFFNENNQWLIKDAEEKIYTPEKWAAECHSAGIKTWGAMLQKILGPATEITLPVYNKPSTPLLADIGFNWHVGNKWPSKKIGNHIWKKIEADLQKKYKISWQKGLDSIDEYAAWIASNRMIISVDSLGLHLANAMNIPIIALFGSTDYKLHDAGLSAHYINFDAPKDTYNCMPCWKSDCFQKIHCSEHLDFNKIYTIVENTLN